MLTLREAAELLGQADGPAGLIALAAALGFTAESSELHAEDRARLSLPSAVRSARVTRSTGALRALLIECDDTQAVREILAEVATALTHRTAHVLWMVIAGSSTGDVAIACWETRAGRPRLLALQARRTRVVASDAETLASLVASSVGDDLLVHGRWCELLGREALSRRFYRVLEQRVAALDRSLPDVPAADRHELALLTTSRLLFLCFLQAKGWLNGDRAFLASRFDDCMASGGQFHRRVMAPLFFGTLNTPMRDRAPAARAFGSIPFLNGGLFSRTAAEKRHGRARFSDEALGELFSQLLGAYRFTAREEQADWSEAAVDPEMLGRAFESLMVARERRVTGAFYTPFALVSHLADQALVTALACEELPEASVRTALADGVLPVTSSAILLARLEAITVLDPACGSGAFLVYLLERLAGLQRRAGDTRPISAIRREVLARAIHGVDVNPTAVWLCELRLWLSVVIESDETRMSAVPPLPNLDCNVRVGDSLAGEGFSERSALMGPPARLLRLRARYARASGARKAPLRRALAREERQRALAAIDAQLAALASRRRERVMALRSADLFGERQHGGVAATDESRRLRRRAAALRAERRRLADGGALAFSFPSHFGHVHASGGFSLVIGNPPWVRLHNIAVAERAGLRERFQLFREPAWRPEFRRDEPTGFGAQPDLAALFAERSVQLARKDGAVALLVPAKLWRSLSGGPLRRYLAGARIARVEDWSEAPCAFDAAVYPSCVIVQRAAPARAPAILAVRRRTLALEWPAELHTLGFDRTDPASPWLLLPPDARAAFHRLLDRGVPLGASPLGGPLLGVKCGCNDAFTVNVVEEATGAAIVTHGGRRGRIERPMLRPLLRGDSLTPWRVEDSARAIVWTHDGDGKALHTLPLGAMRWLSPWRRQLSARTDLHGSQPWWTLFRIDGADSRRARVVWGDFGRRPRAAMLPPRASVVPLNSCYVLPCNDVVDALTLTALLNSPVAAAWLNALAEPARGGWHRYLAWTVSLLPLPRDWSGARELLAPLTERALLGDPPDDHELLEAVVRAYRLRRDDVAPLVAWCG